MSNSNPPETATASPNEQISAMFASMVLQQTNMATIFLGLAPHPQSGKVEQDLEHAKYFIDQLEMLENKTRGNLDKHEENLLKRSLTSLRLAFVEAVSKPAEQPPAAEPQTPATPPAPTEGAAPPPNTGPVPASDDDSRKKYSKKY
jgi:hypothetical protein